MPASRFRPASFAATLLALMALVPSPAHAARTAAEAERLAMFARRYKQLQQHLLLEGEEREGERDGDRLRPAPGEPELVGPLRIEAPARGAVGAPPRNASALTTNVRANNPSLDNAGATQSEVSVAALGDNVLLAFNDGQSLAETQGYAWSINGGVSFTDGGVPPGIPGWTWSSDPVVVINEKTGEFWYTALNDAGGQNGIAVVKATFSGGTIHWGTPHMVRAVNNGVEQLDKEWMAVDPASGRLYVIYTRFSASTDDIEFQSSADGGVTWSTPLALSDPADDGYVQGARVAVGPAGEVYATWNAIGLNAPYQDAYPVRKSTNGGVSFTPEVRPAGVFSNFSSGAPGFNRGRGVTFPTLAVDRSNGPHRGRVYLGWQECVDFYNDNLGTGPGAAEVEPNDTYPQASAFAVGDSIEAMLGAAGDLDLYSFAAAQGQTVVLFAFAAVPSAALSMRLVCGDANGQLALSAPGAGQPNLIVFTIPFTGTYYLRMKSLTDATPYAIYTGFHVPVSDDRARDHRDVFVASSDDGVVWSAPVRVNNDLPWFDDWLPELAVSNQSKLYASWYDWRDAPAAACNARSQVYLASSDNGGATWATLGAMSDAPGDWTDWLTPPAKSNLAPNQGDYNVLFADCQAVYGAWSDARDADVNVYTGRYPPLSQPTLVTFASATALPNQVTVAWQASGGTPLSGTVERLGPGGLWTSLGPCATDGSGLMVYVDATVKAGTSYQYRLVIPQPPGASWISCEVRVDVPIGVNRLVLSSARPNPTQTDIIVSFGLPSNAPATLKLYDLTGREVYALEVGSLGPGSLTLNLGSYVRLRSGVYFVRLAQGGQDATSRISVVR